MGSHNRVPLTVERIRELLDYDPMTGVFTTKKGYEGLGFGRRAGKTTPDRDGYLEMTIDGKWVFAHRIAWAHFYGVMPEHYISHRNEKRDDNRIANLMELTRAETKSRSRSVGRFGFKGVDRPANSKWFRAVFTFNGVTKNNHTFLTAQDAARWYDEQLLAAFGDIAMTNAKMGLLKEPE